MKALRVLAGVLLAVLNILVTAVTFQTLFNWFVVPLGFAPIGMANSYGLMLIFIFIAFRLNLADKKPKDTSVSVLRRLFENLGKNCGMSVAALIIGWVTVSLM
jgi:hypothetical protein